jgi:hypothetical protein
MRHAKLEIPAWLDAVWLPLMLVGFAATAIGLAVNNLGAL